MDSQSIVQEYLIKTDAPIKVLQALQLLDRTIQLLRLKNQALLENNDELNRQLTEANRRGGGYYAGIHSRPP